MDETINKSTARDGLKEEEDDDIVKDQLGAVNDIDDEETCGRFDVGDDIAFLPEGSSIWLNGEIIKAGVGDDGNEYEIIYKDFDASDLRSYRCPQKRATTGRDRLRPRAENSKREQIAGSNLSDKGIETRYQLLLEGRPVSYLKFKRIAQIFKQCYHPKKKKFKECLTIGDYWDSLNDDNDDSDEENYIGNENNNHNNNNNNNNNVLMNENSSNDSNSMSRRDSIRNMMSRISEFATKVHQTVNEKINETRNDKMNIEKKNKEKRKDKDSRNEINMNEIDFESELITYHVLSYLHERKFHFRTFCFWCEHSKFTEKEKSENEKENICEMYRASARSHVLKQGQIVEMENVVWAKDYSIYVFCDECQKSVDYDDFTYRCHNNLHDICFNCFSIRLDHFNRLKQLLIAQLCCKEKNILNQDCVHVIVCYVIGSITRFDEKPKSLLPANPKQALQNLVKKLTNN